MKVVFIEIKDAFFNAFLDVAIHLVKRLISVPEVFQMLMFFGNLLFVSFDKYLIKVRKHNLFEIFFTYLTFTLIIHDINIIFYIIN